MVDPNSTFMYLYNEQTKAWVEDTTTPAEERTKVFDLPEIDPLDFDLMHIKLHFHKC